MNKLLRELRYKHISLLLPILLVACGGGGGGSSSNQSSVVPSGVGNDDVDDVYDAFAGGFGSIQSTINNSDSINSCTSLTGPRAGSTITGTVSYERVPLGVGGLNYGATVNAPARGVIVEAVQASGSACGTTVLDTTIADANGDYGLIVPQNQAVCGQARAQLYRAGTPAWDIQVTDNTQQNAAYYLVDDVIATPNDEPVRDLLAASGWSDGAGRYTGTRSAGPFAILDSTCHALDAVLATDNTIRLPTLHYRWSENNNIADDNLADGDVGGAFFSQSIKRDSGDNIIDVANEIFLLGDDGVDTDEYDAHVITHEYTHYLTANVSRSDSYGGSHALGDILDMTVAFDEGLANAFSGVFLDGALASHVPSPGVYQDNYGLEQDSVFKFDLASRGVGVAGWFNESSIYQIVYNLFDNDNSGSDALSLGFPVLYSSLTAVESRESFVSIYTYLDQIKADNPGLASAVNDLASSENVLLNDEFGSGQTLPSGLNPIDANDILPIYLEVNVASEETVCSSSQYGVHNKLSVIRYLQFNAPSNRSYTVTLDPVDDGKPAIELYRLGDFVEGRLRSTTGTLTFTTFLNAGRHAIAVYDVDLIDPEQSLNDRQCFTLTIG